MGSEGPAALESGELLEGLDDAQRHAVTIDALPLCIVAGAGTGKTRVLTRRLAWRATTARDDPRRVLALTFTRAAATELTVRLRSLGVRETVRTGTFHAVAWTELRERWAAENRAAPTLLARPTRLLSRVLDLDRSTLAAVAAELAWARARRLDLDAYAVAAAAAGRRPPIPAHQMAEVGRDYEVEKRRRGVVDFEDLLDRLATTIEIDPEFATAQRWRFRHLYVDEVQDLNPLQLRLLEAWRGGRPDLCCVGDPNQAIYAWNGADPTLIERFGDRVTGATVVTIGNNYRSTPQVLSLANAVLDAGDLGGVRLQSRQADGPVPIVHRYDDDEAEAVGVARVVLDSRRPGWPWSHQAVLARTNGQLELVAAALDALGVPVRRPGRARFSELPAVRAALRELGTTATDLAEAASRLSEAAREGTVDDTGPEAAADAVALARLAELAEDYRRVDPRGDAVGFRSWLVANIDEIDGGDGVAVRTFHSAKGLEWPVVHVVGLEAGLVPLARATTPDAEAEERRLFFVAVTRAQRVLRLSWAATRGFGAAAPVPRHPSPYLTELAEVLRELTAAATPADGREHLAAMRAVLAVRRPAG